MTKIIKFFAREHLIGNLLTFLLVVFGIVSLASIQRDIWPNVNFEVTAITTVLPGASPDQVENLIVNPIEEAVREVDGIKKVLGTATEGTGIVVLMLDPDARDSRNTNRDIRSAIDAISNLPEEALDPIINEANTDLTPMIELTIASKNGDFSLIRDTAKLLYDKLTLVKGVGKVSKSGYLDSEIHIIANQEKLAKNNISLTDLINAVKGNNISSPAGETYDEENIETLVKTESELKKLQQIENTVVKANDYGFNTKIKDVAQVKKTFSEPRYLYKANGQKTINLLVSKKSNADAITLTDTLKEKISSWQKEISDDVILGYSNDFSNFLRVRLATLTSNLFIGLILVVIILSIFLPWQVTLVVSAGIPIALLSAISVAFMFGATFNLISLIGLIIVLGMLVDDAIVVSENIWRHIEKGDPVNKAVVTGAIEVLGPVTASILTTISAFGPMLFMTGIFGKFIFEIPQMVIIALAFSAFEAFIIMPSHFASWVGPFINQAKLKKKMEDGNRWYDKYILAYQRYVRWTIRWRYLMLVGMGICMIGLGAILASTGRFILFPAEGEQFFFVQVEAPKGTSLEQMATRIESIEAAISTLPQAEIKDFISTIGIIQQNPNDPQSRRGSNYANIRVALTPKHTRERNVRKISSEVRTKIGMPKGISKINIDFAKEGPPQGRAISINILGSDFDTLSEISKQVIESINKIKGTIDIRDSYIVGKDEWQVVPRPTEVASVGLSSFDIAQTLRAAFAGLKASAIRDFDEEIDILVKQEKKSGEVLEQLQGIKVGNRLGNLINLSSIADFEKKSTISAISHINFKRVVNVSGDVDLDETTGREVLKEFEPQLKKLIKKYPGYSYEFGGESEDTDESMRSLAKAFMIAALLIASLLIITFKSFIQPILILASIPMGFMGVTIAMLVHNRPFSFMAMLGVIALAGVIVNNSIVLIDFVNKRRKEGVDDVESIVEAAGVRLRPIVLTTVTTVCGLLPTAYGGFIYKIFGVGGNDPFIVPIALALGWGLGFGSFLTGLVFPCFIKISDDIRNFFEYLWTKTWFKVSTLILILVITAAVLSIFVE